MSMDFETEFARMLTEFRLKTSELNVVNDEVAGHEKQATELYKSYMHRYKEYQDYCEHELEPVRKQLTEIRSEIQAMQAKNLDRLIEFLLKERNRL